MNDPKGNPRDNSTTNHLTAVAVSMTLLIVLAMVSVASQARRPADHPRPEKRNRFHAQTGVPSSDPAKVIPPHLNNFVLVDTFIIADYTFDDSLGMPDPQGWITFDRTVQDTFWHVDDFDNLHGTFAPLEGDQSMWCGKKSPPSLVYQEGGYDNFWVQYIESVPFCVSGDVDVDFLLHHETMGPEDPFTVNYLSVSGLWQTLATYSEVGHSFEHLTIPTDSLDTTATIRFTFVSDYIGSDGDGLNGFNADGAVYLDSLTVSDSGGIVDFQDFEAEAVGALGTADGDWQAFPHSFYGDFAGLFDGSTVLQEDSTETNTTNLWGFFNGSSATYNCGGHPGQAAVPYTDSPGSVIPSDYLINEIWSPWIYIEQDVNGNPVTGKESMILWFDLYGDIQIQNMIFYDFAIRSDVDGEVTPWQVDPFIRFESGTQWTRQKIQLIQHIAPGAPFIQIALRVVDMCWFWCPAFGDGDCHSHGPLFDNVRLTASDYTELIVTNTNDSGVGSMRRAMMDADEEIGYSSIVFNIPGPGPHVIQPLTVLQRQGEGVLINGQSQPGYTTTPLIELDGSLINPIEDANGLWLVGDRSGVRGLAIHSFPRSGLRISGNGMSFYDNYIGADASGTVMGNAQDGILLWGTGNHIGLKDFVERGNLIVGNGENGITHAIASTGNYFYGNRIHSNTGLGIDLKDDGVTPNDPEDVDVGWNSLQNYPVITFAVAATSTISGTLNSVPETNFRIDFFASAACDPSGYGEGERWLGWTEVTSDPSGNVSFDQVMINPFVFGEVITATASNSFADGTSEFSQCFNVPLTITVSNTNDSGAGSLRDAIIQANTTGDKDVIAFNIPGPGPHTIQLTSALPTITQPIHIDGFTQPGASPVAPRASSEGVRAASSSTPVLKVELDGSGIAATAQGLFILTDSCEIRGLVINGFGANGIAIVSADYNVVEGNFIGTDCTGTVDKGNGASGVFCRGVGNRIGGAIPGEGNLISGNQASGIWLDDGTDNLIAGNLIGTDAAGTTAIPNSTYGIAVWGTENGTVIGGDTAEERNVISGNTNIGIVLTETPDITIIGNYIGTDINCAMPLPNGSRGVNVNGPLSSVKVGGGNSGEGNTIAYNTMAGVGIAINATGNNTVSSNSIYSNGNLGIDLAAVGVNPNVPDAIQDFPVLTSVVTSPSDVQIVGSVEGAASTNLTVEFFANTSCDPSGHGEGERLLGGSVVMTDGGGIANFSLTIPAVVNPGEHITATATGFRNSEFSVCFEAINTPSGMSVTVDPVDETTGTSPVTLTFGDVTTGGSTSLTTSDTGPAVPGAFVLGTPPTYYDITTTAVFSGSVEVCINYDENTIPLPESDLMLLHYNETLMPPDWEDITTLVDTTNNFIYGVSDTLSPFVLTAPNPLTGIGDQPAPIAFALHQNVPNPFNPTTTISYDVPAGGADVELRIYDVAGRLVTTLVNGRVAAGRNTALWDGRNSHGQQVATGVYFYRLATATFTQTRKMVLLK